MNESVLPRRTTRVQTARREGLKRSRPQVYHGKSTQTPSAFELRWVRGFGWVLPGIPGFPTHV
jgi:hypothetical protein